MDSHKDNFENEYDKYVRESKQTIDSGLNQYPFFFRKQTYIVLVKSKSSLKASVFCAEIVFLQLNH